MNIVFSFNLVMINFIFYYDETSLMIYSFKRLFLFIQNNIFMHNYYFMYFILVYLLFM